MNLQHRQQKIQDKRKQTPWREFVREIASWFPLNFYKYDGILTKYPNTDRKGTIILSKDLGSQVILEQEYSGTFFENYFSLYKKSYHTNVNMYGDNENCDYSEAVYGAKNGYLSFSIGNNSENILYSCFTWLNVTNVLDSFFVEHGSQNIYSSTFIHKSSNIFYSKNITNCHNVYFSLNLVGCSECIYCDNLINSTYCINNKQYTHESYFLEKDAILRKKENFGIALLYGNCNDQFNSNSITNAYFCRDVSNGNNIFCGAGGNQGSSNMFDIFDGGNDSHDFYGVGMSGTGSSQIYCSYGIGWSHNMFYCFHCEASSFCLGCIGLKNKSYCILNKQYSKEERYIKVDEIFAQMEREGTLGEFFPATMNPFYFNDTAAYLIDPTFTKEEVTALGYLRRDEEIKVDIPEWMETVTINELADYEGRKDETGKIIRHSEGNEAKCNEIEESFGYQGDPSTGLPPRGLASQRKGQGTEQGTRRIDPSILKKVIIDEKGNSYRVIKMEYDFLMKYGLPLPRKHWLERMKENFRIS